MPNKPFSFFYYCTKPHKKWAILAVIGMMIGALLNTYLVVILKNLTDALTQPSHNLDRVWIFALLYPLVYLVSQSIYRVSGFTGMRWFTSARATGFNELYKYTSHHSKSYFQDHFSGSLVTNVSNAVENSEEFFARILWVFGPTFFSLVGFIYFSVRSDVRLGAIIFIWSVIFVTVNYFLVGKLQPISMKAAELRSVLKGKMVDSFSNISIVHEHAHLNGEFEYISNSVHEQRKAGLRNWQRSEWVMTLNVVLIAIFMAAMVWTSLVLMNQHIVTLGVVVMVVAMVTELSNSLFFIGSEMVSAGKDYSGIREGLNEIVQPHTLVSRPNASDLKLSEGKIELKNVSFDYGGARVFKDLNLEITAGQKVGLVGQSGAGKSTFVALLLRHYDLQHGEILVDGQNITDVTLESLRKAIAYVPQDTSLFHRSIRENIMYGSPRATQDEVERVARLARAHDFIMRLPKGYDTLVGERGVRLSGGQRQRVAIARAFLKDAPILVLDEATSSLDSQSEGEVQKALAVLMKGRTVIAIAHRLSTLKEMDRIVLIEDGGVLEDGSPDTLLKKKNGIFKSLWDHQVSGFIVDEE